MAQAYENISKNLDVDKKDLNGQFLDDKSQFLLTLLRIMIFMKLHMIYKFFLVRI